MTREEAIEWFETHMPTKLMPVAKKAYEMAISALTHPHGEWISVEDRLPDTNGTYIVYAPTYYGGSSSGLDNINGIMFARRRGRNWSIEVGYHKRPNCVTHWMPLPEPPEDRG